MSLKHKEIPKPKKLSDVKSELEKAKAELQKLEAEIQAKKESTR